jgi:hypothetical protein
VAASFGEVERRGQDDLSTRTLWSVAAGKLFALSFSSASYSRFGHRGGGDDAACAGHVPHSVHVPMRPRSPHGVGCRV